MLKFILADDNAAFREQLIFTLQEEAGVKVVATAYTAMDAVVLSRHSSWDLIVLDMFLHGSSGLAVLNHLAHRGHKKIVVLTSYATDDIRAKCIELGADAVFDKAEQVDALIDYCLAQQMPAGRPSQHASFEPVQ